MIDRVQDHLEAIYGITCAARAEGFLVDREAAVLLGATGRADEELLVAEGDGELELALYLAPTLLRRLESYESSSLHCLLERELDGFCQVAEGVSHFVYVTHTAVHGRTVSLLELARRIIAAHDGKGSFTTRSAPRSAPASSRRRMLSTMRRWFSSAGSSS